MGVEEFLPRAAALKCARIATCDPDGLTSDPDWLIQVDGCKGQECTERELASCQTEMEKWRREDIERKPSCSYVPSAGARCLAKLSASEQDCSSLAEDLIRRSCKGVFRAGEGTPEHPLSPAQAGCDFL